MIHIIRCFGSINRVTFLILKSKTIGFQLKLSGGNYTNNDINHIIYDLYSNIGEINLFEYDTPVIH